jgi:hypothetical protein
VRNAYGGGNQKTQQSLTRSLGDVQQVYGRILILNLSPN